MYPSIFLFKISIEHLILARQCCWLLTWFIQFLLHTNFFQQLTYKDTPHLSNFLSPPDSVTNEYFCHHIKENPSYNGIYNIFFLIKQEIWKKVDATVGSATQQGWGQYLCDGLVFPTYLERRKKRHHKMQMALSEKSSSDYFSPSSPLCHLLSPFASLCCTASSKVLLNSRL